VCVSINIYGVLNPLNTKLNPICHLLALLGAHPILHISRIRDNSMVSSSDCTYQMVRCLVISELGGI